MLLYVYKIASHNIVFDCVVLGIITMYGNYIIAYIFIDVIMIIYDNPIS